MKIGLSVVRNVCKCHWQNMTYMYKNFSLRHYEVRKQNWYISFFKSSTSTNFIDNVFMKSWFKLRIKIMLKCRLKYE